MTEKYLVRKTAEATGLSKRQVRRVLDAFEVILKTKLYERKTLKFLDFTIETYVKKQYWAHNPYGQHYQKIDPHYKSKVKMSLNWRELIDSFPVEPEVWEEACKDCPEKPPNEE